MTRTLDEAHRALMIAMFSKPSREELALAARIDADRMKIEPDREEDEA